MKDFVLSNQELFLAIAERIIAIWLPNCKYCPFNIPHEYPLCYRAKCESVNYGKGQFCSYFLMLA